jgi:hypothetical protein
VRRLRRFLEEHGARIRTPEACSFETEGEADRIPDSSDDRGGETRLVWFCRRGGPLGDYSRLQEHPCREGQRECLSERPLSDSERNASADQESMRNGRLRPRQDTSWRGCRAFVLAKDDAGVETSRELKIA